VTDDRPLLLGEAPSERGDRYHMFPLSGPPARVLCEMAGIPPESEGSTYGRWTWALYDRFECRNVFDRYAQATPWSAPAARDRVHRFARDLDSRVVVCLGRRVQAAVCGYLGIEVEPFYYWRLVGSTRLEPDSWLHLVAIPHPSGKNRTLNDRAERARSGDALRAALDLAAQLAAK
jgi:uracil-DNA glycosylase